MKEPHILLVNSSMKQAACLIEKAQPVLQVAIPDAGLLAEPYKTILPGQPIMAAEKPSDQIKPQR